MVGTGSNRKVTGNRTFFRLLARSGHDGAGPAGWLRPKAAPAKCNFVPFRLRTASPYRGRDPDARFPFVIPDRRTTRLIASTRSLNWSVPATTRGRRRPQMRSSKLQNLSEIFALQRSSSWICSSMTRERSRPIAPSSTYRSSSRAPEPQHLAPCAGRGGLIGKGALPCSPSRTLWPGLGSWP